MQPKEINILSIMKDLVSVQSDTGTRQEERAAEKIAEYFESDAYFAVAELPKKYRTVIYLYYYEEMTVREIAESLAVSEGTVKSQLHRGRELLRKKLKGGENFV